MSRCSGLGSRWVAVASILVCVDSWAISHFRIGPTDLHTECKQKPGGSSSGGQDSGNPTNKHELSTGPGCFNRHRSGELRSSPRDRHLIIFHVGIPHLAERYSGPTLEVDL